MCVDPHDAGDIVTSEKFGAFELELDYNISPGGNSGIIFTSRTKAVRCGRPDRSSSWRTTRKPPIRNAAVGFVRVVSACGSTHGQTGGCHRRHGGQSGIIRLS